MMEPYTFYVERAQNAMDAADAAWSYGNFDQAEYLMQQAQVYATLAQVAK